MIHDRVEDLNKAVSLVFAIFHIDLGELISNIIYFTNF